MGRRKKIKRQDTKKVFMLDHKKEIIFSPCSVEDHILLSLSVAEKNRQILKLFNKD